MVWEIRKEKTLNKITYKMRILRLSQNVVESKEEMNSQSNLWIVGMREGVVVKICSEEDGSSLQSLFLPVDLDGYS